jgi:hypothetical protein
MAIMSDFVSGQNIRYLDKIVNPFDIEPWITDSIKDYQLTYEFGFSDELSDLMILVTKDSSYAQLRTGKWIGQDWNLRWVHYFENLTNVRIEKNKFISDKSRGEFVQWNGRKALIVYRPWSNVAKRGEYEIGVSGFKNYLQGKFTCASSRLLTEDELKELSVFDLRIMRNEILARYGYIFREDEVMNRYFRRQSWYQGYHQNVSRFLTGIEKQNIGLILEMEKEKEGL